MMGFKNPFYKKPQRDDVALARLRGWMNAALGNPAATFTISEIECGDPACPGLETIILVMREGAATQAMRIRKPIAKIDEADVQAALANLD